MVEGDGGPWITVNVAREVLSPNLLYVHVQHWLTFDDNGLDSQEKKEIPLSVHALLTHLVDEASAACEELQRGVEGATSVTPPSQKEAAQ